MGVPREEVRQMLEGLPDETSYEEIQYHIYVRQKVDHALEAAEQEDLIEQEEVERRMARWIAE